MAKPVTSDAVVKYRAEHSPTVFYLVGVMTLVAGVVVVGMGVSERFATDPLKLYAADATCQEKLLLDGDDHLTRPCGVLEAKVDISSSKGELVNFKLTRSHDQVRQLPDRLPNFYAATFPELSSTRSGQVFRLQVFDDQTQVVVMKALDVKSKAVYASDYRSPPKADIAWHTLKIGLIMMGAAIAWILLGALVLFD